jgi:hypothetical protein
MTENMLTQVEAQVKVDAQRRADHVHVLRDDEHDTGRGHGRESADQPEIKGGALRLPQEAEDQGTQNEGPAEPVPDYPQPFREHPSALGYSGFAR